MYPSCCAAKEMSQMSSLDPTTTIALIHAIQRGIDKDPAREAVGPGVYKDISVELRVHVGEMRVGNDTDRAPTSSIPWLAVCGLMVKRMGLQRDAALETMREALLEAFKLDKDAQAILLKETGVAEAEDMIKEEVIAKLPRTPTKGQVTVKDVEIEVITRQKL